MTAFVTNIRSICIDKFETKLKTLDDINITNSDGETLLISCISWHNVLYRLEKVKMLLNLKIDVNKKDNYGRTALMHAVVATSYTHSNMDTFYIDIIKLLLDSNADMNIIDKEGINIIDLLSNDKYIIRLAWNASELIKIFISHGLDINITNKRGQTILICACIYDCTPVVIKVLNFPDIDVNIKDSNNKSALMYACYCYDSGKIIPLLLEKGAIIDDDCAYNGNAVILNAIIKNLKKEIGLLKTQILYQPEGLGYHNAKQEFESFISK